MSIMDKEEILRVINGDNYHEKFNLMVKYGIYKGLKPANEVVDFVNNIIKIPGINTQLLNESILMMIEEFNIIVVSKDNKTICFI